MSSVQEHPTAFLSAFPKATTASLPTVAVKKDSRKADLVFGSVSGCFGKLIEFPFDTIKVRLQTQPLGKHFFNGPWDCLRKTVKNEGFKGLYKGLSTPLFGAMLENATLFVCYNHIQKMILNGNFMGKSDTTGLGTEPPPLSIPQLCAAGALSGAAVSFLLTPIELIKCQLQVSQLSSTRFQHDIPTGISTTPTASISATGQSIPTPKHLAAKTYQGPVSVALHNLRTRGLLGFYRGHTGTFLRETGGGAAWFGVYEVMCRWLIHRHQYSIEPGTQTVVTKDDLGPGQLMLAGALAGMAFNAILFPADVVKSQMQTEGVGEDITSKKSPRNFNTVARDIWRLEGPKGFFRGFGITVGRSAPTSAVIFMTYEMLTRNFARIEAER